MLLGSSKTTHGALRAGVSNPSSAYSSPLRCLLTLENNAKQELLQEVSVKNTESFIHHLAHCYSKAIRIVFVVVTEGLARLACRHSNTSNLVRAAHVCILISRKTATTCQVLKLERSFHP